MFQGDKTYTGNFEMGSRSGRGVLT